MKIKQIIIGIALLVGVSAAVLLPDTTYAVNAVEEACKIDPSSTICNSGGDSAGDIIRTVVNTLLFLLGIAAVIVIIISGLIYVTSGGDSNNVQKAKNMLLYAVIGLVVAISAYAIVIFVDGQF